MPALVFPLPDLDATARCAAALAPFLQSGDVVALYGDLGSGKTTLTRALLSLLGVEGEVPSPTFTLVQFYPTARFGLTHFDLYRLQSPDELDELGWDEARAEGVVCVEWPERAAHRLPEDHLAVHITDVNGQRLCRWEPHGVWRERLKDNP